MMFKKAKTAIIGSGNIGTDLMFKIIRTSEYLELKALVGIDPDSDGLNRAARSGVATFSNGIDGLVGQPLWDDIDIVFDATSAKAHKQHSEIALNAGKVIVDLTPAAIGPFVVPVVNGEQNIGEKNINMVTCGGQATIPIVAAVNRVSTVHYAEIVASISSKSAGPGTRANIDEFTQTTSTAIEKIGGAAKGKAIIILNPAEPPMVMRDTVFTLSSGATEDELEASIRDMVAQVQTYVPGYRLKQEIQFEHFGSNRPIRIAGHGVFEGVKTTIFLEVEGAAHYLPAYAGNLDIMTSAALATAEKIAQNQFSQGAV